MAIAGAEKIVGHTIDKAANNEIIDNLVAELQGGRSWAAGREQQMERSLLIVLISWKTTQEVLGNQCQGQSAGKAFLIGINSWTGMLAKNLTIHCPF